MNAEIKKQWVEALRSGEYVQADSVLRAGPAEFCCLGVLCDLHRIATAGPAWGVADSYFDCTEYMPTVVSKWAGLPPGGDVALAEPVDGCFTLAEMNDNGQAFDEIADVIEKEL